MKNKKKILSLLACLLLLTSCNKSTPSSSSCKTTTSTPSVEPTPTPTPEKLNIFDYANTSTITSTDDLLVTGTLQLNSFNNQLTDEMKLTVEEITIPEEINGVKLTSINNVKNGLFNGFNNLKRIKISKNIAFIYSSSVNDLSSPFMNLPSLESIEIDPDNEYYYVINNCVIKKEWTTSFGNRNYTGNENIIFGYDDVIIPDTVTTIDGCVFAYSSTLKTIKMTPNITSIDKWSFRFIPQLSNIDLNGNTKYKIEGNVLYDADSVDSDGNYTGYIYTGWGEITIPSDINKISNDFGRTSLSQLFSVTKLTIPSTVKEISEGNQSIYLDNLTDIVVDSNPNFEFKDNVLLSNSNTTVITAIKDAIIPSTVTKLDITLYSKNLSSIFIPKSVTKLSGGLFNYCSALKKENVTFEDGSQFVVDGNCIVDTNSKKLNIILEKASVKELVIPNNVNDYLDSLTFKGLTSLERIIFGEDYTSLSSTSFLDNDSPVKEFVFKSKNITYLNKYNFYKLKSLEKITLPEENAKYKQKGNVIYDQETNEMIISYGAVDLTLFDDISKFEYEESFGGSITSFRLSKNITGISGNFGTFLTSNTIKVETIYLDDMTYEEFKSWYAYQFLTYKGVKYSKIVFSDNTSKTKDEILNDVSK